MDDTRLEFDEEAFFQRITSRLGGLDPESPGFKETMLRLAMRLEAETKINIRTPSRTPSGRMKPLIDTGRLLNSIRYDLRRRGERTVELSVVSQAVPYARFWEEGYSGAMSIAAHQMRLDHFWHQKVDPIIVQVRAHTRYVQVQARPYMAPAIQKMRPIIRQAMQDLTKET
jgi:hypothetical protein